MMLLLAAMLSGCAVGQGQFDVNNASKCEPDRYGWCGFTRKTAVETFEYAQMANNAYAGRRGRPMYTLPPDLVERYSSPRKSRKFSYAVFDRMEDGRVVETIIAYRGTDSVSDWFTGNFSRRQNKQGEMVYQTIAQQLREAGYQAVPITVTGHSLGGGISSSVSQGKPGVKTYVFNASPNFRAMNEDDPPRRLAVAEYGEFLKLARVFKGSGNQQYVSINCHTMANLLGPVADHSVRKLADCLTWIAWRADYPRAAQALALNPDIQPPDTERKPDEP